MLRTMKKIFIMLFLGTGVAAAAQTPFADCFFDKTMRKNWLPYPVVSTSETLDPAQ